MPHSNFDASLEVKFLAETGVFEGYASVFNVTDSANDRILPGAFRDSLEKFRCEGRLPPLLWQHDTAEPIGAWREMHEDDHGLFVKGELFINDSPQAMKAYRLLKENVVTGLSIGYRTRESRRDQKSNVRILMQLDLLEVSLVTFPANEHARVSSVKKVFGGAGLPSERELEIFLRRSGFSRRQSKGLIAKGYRGLAPDPRAADAVLRLCASLFEATEDNKKAVLESALPLDTKSARRSACVESLRRSLLCAAAENLVKAGFNPAQPRVPTGDADGGQWTAGGGGGGRSRAPSGGDRGRGSSFVQVQPRRRVEGGIVPEPPARSRPAVVGKKPSVGKPSGIPSQNPAKKPGSGIGMGEALLWGGGAALALGAAATPVGRALLLGGAAAVGRRLKPATAAIGRILKPVGTLSKTEAAAVTEAVAGRAAGKPLATHESNAKLKRAADSIEEYLGGPGKFIRNSNGDTVIMRGDKKVRFDIKKTNGDRPHFQFEKRVFDGKKEKWIDAGEQHRYYFKEGE